MADQGRAALALVRAVVTARGARAVVLLDGPSGSGKTTLAACIHAATGIAVLHLDDLYPGWTGLEAAGRLVHDGLLAPRATGRSPLLRRWDWAAGREGGEIAVPAGPLLVEGSGVLTRANRRLAAAAVWLELPADERRRRALARDGATYEPWWEAWAEQEARFAERERPTELADLVLAPGPHRSKAQRPPATVEA
jgi:uridine kinase